MFYNWNRGAKISQIICNVLNRKEFVDPPIITSHTHIAAVLMKLEFNEMTISRS